MKKEKEKETTNDVSVSSLPDTAAIATKGSNDATHASDIANHWAYGAIQAASQH
ncbi:hypothetical protein HUB98_10005 [Paenibacillus barcinonensis]|uniref:FMN-binding protein n=1 Tax=Paenibacillus barcinonensis TaxID=198119 RepID=A0ABX6Q381_PAEBA|nr:hypothetical protein [Paenibacillus barcinonensis]QKS56639.1 hypothetical protein HUB98_10005 [Paenibacillus barcinonensis]